MLVRMWGVKLFSDQISLSDVWNITKVKDKFNNIVLAGGVQSMVSHILLMKNFVWFFFT